MRRFCKNAALAVIMFFAVSGVLPAYGAAPIFVNNGVAGITVAPGAVNALSLDVTLPAPDADVFLDGDGFASSGSGFPGVVAAGTPFTSIFPNSICGNTDGTVAPTKLRADSNFDCTSIDGVIILGADTVGTIFNMGAASSQVRFIDLDADGAWDDGEDIYFDADASGSYNADTLDALTVRNLGTAVATADIAVVKLWRDANGDNTFGAGDTLLGACPWDGVNDWECDVNFTFTSAPRVFVTVDIAPGATPGRTVQLQIAALFDSGTLGSFNPGDTGIFFASNHDGPAAAITNGGVHTIGASSPVASCVFEPPVTNADFALKDGTTLPIKFYCLNGAGTVLTTVQNVALWVTGLNASGATVTYIFSLADGTLIFDATVSPPHYVASFSTKTYSVKDGGSYVAQVKSDGAIVGTIDFTVSISTGTGRGNSGK